MVAVPFSFSGIPFLAVFIQTRAGVTSLEQAGQTFYLLRGGIGRRKFVQGVTKPQTEPIIRRGVQVQLLPQ